MSTAPARVYVARLLGLPVFDPMGDQVGKVRDLVVTMRSEASPPRVLGLVAEVFGRRRIFVPMTRVTNIDSGQVYTTGLLNMRRFEQRSTETLVIGQMLDRRVTIPGSNGPIVGTVYDVAMEQGRNRDWVLSRVAVQEPTKGLRRRGQTHVVGVARRPGPDPPRQRRPGGHPPAPRAQRDAARRRGDDDPRPPARAARRGRRRPHRRAAGRRARGAARGGPGRDPRAPRLRTRRRRPRGDVGRRRRRPDRRPPPGDRGDPARPDGARRRRGRTPADVVRREHGRRR